MPSAVLKRQLVNALTIRESCVLSRSLWKHFRAVSLCLFLLVFPAYMAYMICQFFHMDFWLLIIISSSILTSLQVRFRLTAPPGCLLFPAKESDLFEMSEGVQVAITSHS